MLTLVRILAAPAVIFFILRSESGSSAAATIIFLLAAVTDFFDGLLARRTGTVTEIGKKADPLADRLLISGTIIALAIKGLLPVAGVVLVAARDIFIIVGYKLLEERGVVVRVSILGKAYTALFMTAILLQMTEAGINGVSPGWWLFWAGVAGSLVSGAFYVVNGIMRLKTGAAPEA